MNTTDDEQAPGEIETLLPWHAAGTLNRRDAERVEDALARDPELARRYALVREELAETIHLNETLGAPSARAMEKLFAGIDAEPARRAAPSLSLGARVSDFFASLTPRTLAWSAAAAAVAILLQAGLIAGVMLNERQAGSGFQTASAPGAAQAEGSFALIRFAPQATAADVTRFLQANELSFAGGPAPGGLYRVRIAETRLPQEELAARVAALQADKTVAFIATTE
jgi:anti-sigma factor RsiW